MNRMIFGYKNLNNKFRFRTKCQKSEACEFCQISKTLNLVKKCANIIAYNMHNTRRKSIDREILFE